MKLAPDNTRSWRLRRWQVPARLFGVALAGALLAMPLAALASDRSLLTISTNNTLLDRKALQALSEEAGRRATASSASVPPALHCRVAPVRRTTPAG